MTLRHFWLAAVKGNLADQTNRGELAIWCARHRATTLYSVGTSWDPDHEAVIRFSGEAPGRRTHSHHGIEAMQLRGSSPPRTVIGGRSLKARRMPKLCTLFLLGLWGQAAWRSITPSGILPVVTNRHSSMSSFRARATIIVVLRTPFVPSVRALYH